MAISQNSPSIQESKRRIPEITWLKGFAILCVLLIHARPITDTVLFDNLINRAVPIFIVLFGVTSEKWWSSQNSGTRATFTSWYRTRTLRLMVPVWGMLAVWWAMMISFPHPRTYSWAHFAVSLTGYAPWVGTAWFITLVLELVLFFPALRYFTERVGLATALAVGAIATIASGLSAFHITALMRTVLLDSGPSSGFFYFWIFAPSRFFHVVAGIALARGIPQSTRPRTLLMAGILLLGAVALPFVSPPLWNHTARSLLDVPLTIVLLQAFQVFRSLPGPARALEWCGESSWGIYLGQMTVHNAVHLLVGFPESMAVRYRWAYFFALLVGAVGLVVIGEALRKLRWSDFHTPREVVRPD